MNLSTLYIILRVLAVLILLVLFWAWSLYNQLVRKRNQYLTDLSDTNIQIKRKAELIDRLISLVTDYSKHEKNTYKGVAQARSTLNNAKSITGSAKAENMLTETLRSLMVVIEAYPELKANENYKELRMDLKNLEDKIADYREEYNRSVQTYNNAVQLFPSVLLASILGFKDAELFQVKSSS
ncbi:LemA family protein [Candidatus Woesebacteria bacterium]|nr:LemA family protein [Candidatus Woesebacteria bacterium]